MSFGFGGGKMVRKEDEILTTEDDEDTNGVDKTRYEKKRLQ